MKSLFSSYFFTVSLVILKLSSCQVFGQEAALKYLTADAYDAWETISHLEMSANGAWIQYYKKQPNKPTKAVLQEIESNFIQSFDHARKSYFYQNQFFVVESGQQLTLVNLKTKKEQIFSDHLKHQITKQHHWFALLKTNKILEIYVATINLSLEVHGVQKWQWNEQQNQVLLYIAHDGKHQIEMLTFGKIISRKVLYQATSFSCAQMYWSNCSTAMVWFGQQNGTALAIYHDLQNNTKKTLEIPSSILPHNGIFSPNELQKSPISKDKKRILIALNTEKASLSMESEDLVEIWHAQDDELYPVKKTKDSLPYIMQKFIWNLEKDSIILLNSQKEEKVILSDDLRYAVVINQPDANQKFNFKESAFLTLHCLTSGKKSPITSSSKESISQVQFSPSGNYVIFYQENQWWLYDNTLNKKMSLTYGLSDIWDSHGEDPGNYLRVWGISHWNQKETALYVYGLYDIWKIELRPFRASKITPSENSKKIYRWVSKPSAKSNETQLIHAFEIETGNNAIYAWHENKGLQKIKEEGCSYQWIQHTPHSNTYAYIKQRYDLSPTIEVWQSNRLLLQVTSNPQQQEYYWGKSTMISYLVGNNKKAQGILYYPANYQSNLQYPMVVYLYENLSKGIHQYHPPSMQNGIGFNITNLVSQGYAVLLPNIVFSVGFTGKSALESVSAAVEKVISMGVANPNKIGIYGHSFGGFEVNYIVTQTNLFRAAISGSGVSDPIAHYFTYNTEYQNIDGWRYERQQYRIRKSFYEAKEQYLQNSPLFYANQIETPLLVWSGKTDSNVLPTQSRALYAALRRLGKKHLLLLYPQEGHILTKPKSKLDLTNRIQEWFDHFLKDHPAPSWLQPK